MSDRPSPAEDRAWKPSEVTISLDVAQPARIADYVHGGDAHFRVDREVAAVVADALPDGADALRRAGRDAYAFLSRVVDHTAAEAGVRQYLTVGGKLPGGGNVHDLVQAIVPESRVVYLVLEPIMLAHAHDLVSGAPEGAVACIQARLGDPDEILRQAARTLDLTLPVALIFPASLPFVRRDTTARRIVSQLMDGVPSASFLAITHHASDIRTEELAEAYRRLRELAAEGKSLDVKPRSRDEVAQFFDGLELLQPGVVPMECWRAPDGEPLPPRPGAFYGAVGRKP